MPLREIKILEKTYYHIFNRGADKRNIFLEGEDTEFFSYKMKVLNLSKRKSPLVKIIAFALLPNHFHMILMPCTKGGVSIYLHKLCSIYARYFNKKYERSGVLFQGRFKAKEIVGNLSLPNVSVYVNLNFVHHKLNQDDPLVKTSFNEYLAYPKGNLCTIPKIIFDEIKPLGYKTFAEQTEQIFLNNKITRKLN